MQVCSHNFTLDAQWAFIKMMLDDVPCVPLCLYILNNFKFLHTTTTEVLEIKHHHCGLTINRLKHDVNFILIQWNLNQCIQRSMFSLFVPIVDCSNFPQRIKPIPNKCLTNVYYFKCSVFTLPYSFPFFYLKP